jgi:hypothetical protein
LPDRPPIAIFDPAAEVFALGQVFAWTGDGMACLIADARFAPVLAATAAIGAAVFAHALPPGGDIQ